MADSGDDRVKLAELEVWDRVDRRFRSRVLWTVLLLVLAAGVLVAIGAPLLEARIEREVESRLEARLLERVRDEIAANKLDVAAVRQELRDDAKYIKDDLIASRVDAELKLRGMLDQASKLDQAVDEVEETSRRLNSLRGEVKVLQRNLAGETGRIETLKNRYEEDLRSFQAETSRLTANLPAEVDKQMGDTAKAVERELDELRSILADHANGVPSLWTTWLDVAARKGRLRGTNFGEGAGRVFLRLRAFTPTNSSPVGESDSILVAPTAWSEDAIELALTPRTIEELDEAKQKIREGLKTSASIRYRYGFLVQTADGKMSHWSGKWSDSVVPPSRGTLESADVSANR